MRPILLSAGKGGRLSRWQTWQVTSLCRAEIACFYRSRRWWPLSKSAKSRSKTFCVRSSTERRSSAGLVSRPSARCRSTISFCRVMATRPNSICRRARSIRSAIETMSFVSTSDNPKESIR